jgi:ribosomal protein L11 methylase PrmA
VHYRIERIAQYIDGGDWLDYGCADGGCAHALLDSGAKKAANIDMDISRVETARRTLTIISPNGGPFESHTVHIGHWSSMASAPLIPWLPAANCLLVPAAH